MNVLLIDIGNTRVKWRIVDLDEQGAVADDGTVALSEIDQDPARWIPHAGTPVHAALISNVASLDAGATIERQLRDRWPAMRVTFVAATSDRGGVVNGYANPTQLGPDRWMALIGAHALVPDRSLLVCSLGTATTIDLLVVQDARPHTHVGFVGGMILPGVEAMRRALIGGTARLPDRPGAFVPFANNTEDAITSGILAAQLGAIERALRDARARVGGDALDCLVSGGSAATVGPLLTEAVHGRIHVRTIPDLVLRGLEVVAREARLD